MIKIKHIPQSAVPSPQLVFSQYNLTKSIQNFPGKNFFLQKILSLFIRSLYFKKSPFCKKGGRGIRKILINPPLSPSEKGGLCEKIPLFDKACPELCFGRARGLKNINPLHPPFDKGGLIRNQIPLYPPLKKEDYAKKIPPYQRGVGGLEKLKNINPPFIPL